MGNKRCEICGLSIERCEEIERRKQGEIKR